MRPPALCSDPAWQLKRRDQIRDGVSRPCHSVSPRRFRPAVSTRCLPVPGLQRLCCEHRFLLWAADKQTQHLFPWPRPELPPLGLPCLPVLYPVFFLPGARPDPGPEGQQLWLCFRSLSWCGWGPGGSHSWTRDPLLDPAHLEIVCHRSDDTGWVHVYMCAHVRVCVCRCDTVLRYRSPLAG